MSVVYNNTALLSNIKRQAKRLSTSKEISLTDAQIILARDLYGEKSFKIVRKKIELSQYFPRIYLADLGPECQKYTRDRFVDELAELIGDISNSQLASLYSGEFNSLFSEIFDVRL